MHYVRQFLEFPDFDNPVCVCVCVCVCVFFFFLIISVIGQGVMLTTHFHLLPMELYLHSSIRLHVIGLSHSIKYRLEFVLTFSILYTNGKL
jgi:hypothetical protein